MINVNGSLIKDDKAGISIKNRGLYYGDAVFETIRVIHGKIIFWEDHYFRLMASMRIMRMEIPSSFSPEFLEEEILQIVNENGLENSPARVRMTVYRKEGGYYTPASLDVDYIITATALDNAFYTLPEGDYEVELFKDHYINSGLLSTIKTNNKAVNVLGSIFATENDFKNCFLLNENKSIVEALNANVFVVNGRKIKTPPLKDGALNGIVRKQLLSIVGTIKDFEIEEASISPFELQKADEIFLTNVIAGIQPVTKYRKKRYVTDVARELLAKLNVKARLG
ncbi:aminotransferase class IV [Antarcticibacterium flavum]|uniref:branched-chain-amino-acid transaminase n=1 Tax=Antarcticibacterium flavum TaxID=2058175 RepID=A0A5B7X962_9FLAO|nr:MULTISPECIES: aminotransferase class IV [Antarcticibacterium]MCM4160354.1 aminotransferase class IV [Antarcticibacterium sp. W02-3]QCY71268.1 aminotransferase class IV [Antarcticibacterium flavum]